VSAWLSALGVLVGLLVGLYFGLKFGERVRGRSRAFWMLNGAVFLIGMGVDFAGLVFGQLWLALGALGFIAGSITGLKYGYSESIGIWRTVDTWTGTDKSLRPPDDEDEDMLGDATAGTREDADAGTPDEAAARTSEEEAKA